ncbi:unnamed protein product [Adineta steineri]|uniref:N-acetyltransferase domain-containing protein n=1 Tax=Adineta steineri TaxID=433720 RepID=A0A819HL23_9BILA|nr:unnamed protein product [Adineta steineri]CAF3899888.1 unnamed protein product [Adineta steineri]
MLSSSRFNIHVLREEDRIPALTLLINSFFHDEPLAKCVELEEPLDFAKTIINDAINNQCSFVAYDIQTNQLIGICLNEIKSKDDRYIINETNEKLSFILNLLHNMHKNINLFDIFQTNSLLYIFIINVDKNYRGYRLGSRLISTSIEYARQNRIKGAFAEATSISSLNSFQHQGFLIYHQINYIEYDQIRLSTMIDSHNSQCQLVARIL